MKKGQFFNDLWTCLVVDGQMQVLEVVNPDDKLFFGKHPCVGMPLVDIAGQENSQQIAVIVDGVRRAMAGKRNTCFEYLSGYGEEESCYVCAHVCYQSDGLYKLCLASLEEANWGGVEEKALLEADTVLHAIYENLPIGMEIYDREGCLIEINACELRNIGITDKSKVLGVNLFDNPNLPQEVWLRLKAGVDVSFSQDYDFNHIIDYYETPKKSVSHLEVSIAIMRDKAGEVDKYLVISQDVTERVQLQRQYENLYNQNITILKSLPVGVGLYTKAGKLAYFNESMCKIFGVDGEIMAKNLVHINQNPILPENVKSAVREGIPIHVHFPYDFSKIAEKEYYKSSHQSIRQIECNGRPIFDTDGNMESYVFILEDVTETVRQEEELRQSKRKTELAIRASGIMIWEFDVERRLFFSENEPMNGYDHSKYIDITTYINTVHEDDREYLNEVMQKMEAGEDFTFSYDCRILFPGNPDWQYCTVNGSPYEYHTGGRVTKYVGTRKNNTELHRRKLLQDKILNSIPLPIHIKDIEDNFRYVFCNDESRRMFGTSVEKTTYDVMDVQEVERIQKTDMEVFTTGKPYLGLERIVLKDGRSYDTIVRKSIIHDGGKRLLLNVRWDQGLQNDLERRAKVLSLTMEAMNAYTWFFEPKKDRVSFGEGFDKVCSNVQQVNTVGKFASYIHAEDRQRFVDSIRTLLRQDSGEWFVEYRADLNGNGVYEWWETRGILETLTLNDAPYQYVFGMSICIQAHKQTELTLLKNKEDLNHLIRQNELVLNNTNSGLAYITPDYVVQWENISLCSASLSYEAYKKGEICYKSTHNRTSPCQNCVLERAAKSRQMEQIKFTLDANHIVEVFATPVFKENDELDGIVIRVDDITQRERIFEELHRAKALAEQSDKLKSAFLANMSHEIRTPLNAIVGFSELLMNTTGEADKAEYMQIINSNNELLLKLINDILDLSKLEAGSVELKYEEFDLSEYFNGMAASMKQRVTNPNVRLIAINTYPCCRVNLDRNRIAQIMTNFVTNAIKYTPKGFIEMGYECTNEGIRFYVRDSGIGIPDEKKDKVFHRFEKLDEFAQGTGLGLSICKAIAESMGGSVGFDSTGGEGSYFWAVLPCEVELLPEKNIQEKTETQHPEITTRVTEMVGRKTILIAEDIPSNYLLISAILQKHFDLLHALNGKEVIEMARTQKVDLVLMDMKMPVVDGLTATAEIRKFNRKLPIVALTAHAFEADRLAAFQAGCNDYLVKPIDKTCLMAVLQKYCGSRRN